MKLARHHHPHYRTRARAAAGFTLVEALIASAVVAIGMLATVSLLTWTHGSNDLEQERARAHQIVSQELERVRLELFTRQTMGQTVQVWDNGTPQDATDDTMGTLEVRMRNPDNGSELTAPPNPARRVEVEVCLSWPGRGPFSNRTMRESVMTYLAP